MSTHLGPATRYGWHSVGAVGVGAMVAVMVAASITTRGSLSSAVTVWAVCGLMFVGAVFAAVQTHATPSWWLIWPVTAISLILVFRFLHPEAAVLVPGLLTVSIVYAGLTQPPWRPTMLVPFALIVLYSILNLPLQAIPFRLTISCIVFVAVGELPARLLRQLLDIQTALARAGALDPLTGALNRQHLTEALDDKIGRAFIVMIDLDNFKRHNDRYGHLAGDQVLVDFAGMLRNGSRATDLVVRYGGEEFLVILDGVNAHTVRTAVDRWTRNWAAHPSDLTFSAGITDLDGPAALDRADRALYRAKASGRNTTVTEYSTGTTVGAEGVEDGADHADTAPAVNRTEHPAL